MRLGTKPKGIKLAVLIGGPKPPGDDGEDDTEPKKRKLADLIGGKDGGDEGEHDDGDEIYHAAAREMLDAIKAGDKDALAETLKHLCEEEEAEEDEE